jgi:subtilisin-like proprotein convertase family protein
MAASISVHLRRNRGTPLPTLARLRRDSRNGEFVIAHGTKAMLPDDSMITSRNETFTPPRLRRIFCLLCFIVAGVVALAGTAASNLNSQPSLPTPTSCNGIVTFSNTAPIAIPDIGIATPYPSDITVAGLPNWPIAGTAEVTIHGLTHSFTGDVGIVLVGPGGTALLIQDGAGNGAVANLTYTLSDTGAAQLPATGIWGPGTYKPTSYYTNHSFPPPGPGTAYGNPGPAGGNSATFASIFGGTNHPNGVWSLYVVDFEAGNSGTIAGGWSLSFSIPLPCETPRPRMTPHARPTPH